MERVVRPVVYLAIAGLIFTLFGFRLGHPKSGLSSAAGAANTSLVVYKKSSTYETGNKVLIKIADPKISPSIGIIRTIDDSTLLVQTGEFAVTTPRDQVMGKILGVFPFIGILFNFVGQ